MFTMKRIKISSVSVLCGARLGKDDVFKNEAYALGAQLAIKKLRLVYGGASIGLMGSLADGALNSGGEVIGIIPRFLNNKDATHDKLTKLILVNTLYERKMKIFDLSDCIIALPGGLGTLDELFEVLVLNQLGLQKKYVAILNINKFYNDLLRMLNKMVESGFLSQKFVDLIIVETDLEKLLVKLCAI